MTTSAFVNIDGGVPAIGANAHPARLREAHHQLHRARRMLDSVRCTASTDVLVARREYERARLNLALIIRAS